MSDKVMVNKPKNDKKTCADFLKDLEQIKWGRVVRREKRKIVQK